MRAPFVAMFVSSLLEIGCNLGPGDRTEPTRDRQSAVLSEPALEASESASGRNASPNSERLRFVPGNPPHPGESGLKAILPDFVEHPPAHVPPMPLPRYLSSHEKPVFERDKTKAMQTVSKKLFADGDSKGESPPPGLPVEANSCNIMGTDDRTKVDSTTTYPYSTVAKLYLRFGTTWYGCSATIVRPNFALTAGHCLFNPDLRRWLDQVVVVPAFNATTDPKPFGETAGVEVYCLEGWTTNLDVNYDFGIVKLVDALGVSTGTMGYAAHSDSELLPADLTTAGYPYDYGEATMTTSTSPTADLSGNLICSTLETCSGQSGSGAWLSPSQSVAGVMSGFGNFCNPDLVHTLLARLSTEIFDWMQEIVGTCPCSSGDCCDGCNYRPNTTVCSDSAGDEFRCTGNTCGSDPQKRQGLRYCSGNSALCDGSSAWQDWQTIADCNSNQICKSDVSGASCFNCLSGCTGSTCCVCSSDPCCDGCNYLPSTSVCDDAYQKEYRCDGNSCGANAQQRMSVRRCSGSSAVCEGAIEPQGWTIIEDCTEEQTCLSDSASYARCFACAGGCSGSSCCTCASGVCCDGCSFRTSNVVCDPASTVEFRCAGAECGGFVERKLGARSCSGAAADCSGAVADGQWQRVLRCGPNELCEQDSSGASCRADKSCLPYKDQCTTGPCCDTSISPHMFRLDDTECDPAAGQLLRCSGTHCGADAEKMLLTRKCTGRSADCDGETVSGGWRTDANCTVSQLCRSDASSTYCYDDPACPPKSDLCESGPCCDTNSSPHEFRAISEICVNGTKKATRCARKDGVWGDGCGGVLLESSFDQHCPGDGADCSGELLQSEWRMGKECALAEYCDSLKGCVASAACASGHGDRVVGNGCGTTRGPGAGLAALALLGLSSALHGRRKKR